MHRSKTSIQTSGTWSDKPGNNSAQLSSLNDIPVCVFSTHLIWAQASKRKAFPVLSVLLRYFTKSLMVKAVQVYVREELWTFLGWTIFLLMGCGFFFFRFVTWLSFQSGTNRGCSLLCQLSTMIKLCLSFIRCLNSVFISIWKGKTRNRSTQVFWYEEDKFLQASQSTILLRLIPLNEDFSKCISLLHEKNATRLVPEDSWVHQISLKWI